MTIECYNTDCPLHGCHDGVEGPFCFEEECIKAEKRVIPERPSERNCDWYGDCVEAGVKTCVNCVRMKNAQEAWDREFG